MSRVLSHSINLILQCFGNTRIKKSGETNQDKTRQDEKKRNKSRKHKARAFDDNGHTSAL